MAQIPRKYIDNYTKALNKLSTDAQEKTAEALAKVDMSDVAAARDEIIDIMETFLGPYTDIAAILAAEFYDGVRLLETGAALGALAESGRESIATEKAVRGIMQDVVDGKPESAVKKLLGRADYEIKRSAGECVSRNGRRDPLKPKYARVPNGIETCQFCLMLASRGFVYHDAGTAGERSHYHANCDCRIVPGFGKNPTVEGYDPEELRYLYKGMKMCSIPNDKIYSYLLNSEHPVGKDKAILFKKYLGFTKQDGEALKRQLYISAGKYDFMPNLSDSYGDRFTQVAIMNGIDGKKAEVEIGWIKRPDDVKMSLVTAIPKREMK